MNETLGLIAGSGCLPALLLKEAKERGCRVALCAIHGETSPELEKIADACEWMRVGELGRMVKFFKHERVSHSVMGGKIQKTNLFRGEVRPDLEMIKVLAKMSNHSDDSLLGGIADYLKKKGMPLADTTSLLTEEALPREGILTKRKPSRQEIRDIDFGWKLAKEMGRLDIGQTIVVKKQAILAVEAIEGTDAAIARGGLLGNGDVAVIKVAKPKQDFRFDVPTVGLATLDAMIQARAKVLAIEAGKVILMNRDAFIQKADEHRICLVSRKS